MASAAEVVFYVHGVSSLRRGASHEPWYRAFHTGVAAENPQWPTDFGGAEWGWNEDSGSAKSHQQLTDAQRLLGSRILPVVRNAADFTLNPARALVNSFRELFFYGFGDMFYYVSADGKEAVRLAVAQQLLAHLEPFRQEDPSPPISLTLVGHSAGAVIAFDFLFAIFHNLESGQPHRYLRSTAAAAREVKTEIDQIRSLAANGNFRVRRLITFGSPITPLAFRSDEVLKQLADDEQLLPGDYGLNHNPAAFEQLTGPRLINIWDKDDPIAWPVEPLFQPGGLVEDRYLDVSDTVAEVHNDYWTSDKVHQAIAELW